MSENHGCVMPQVLVSKFLSAKAQGRQEHGTLSEEEMAGSYLHSYGPDALTEYISTRENDGEWTNTQEAAPFWNEVGRLIRVADLLEKLPETIKEFRLMKDTVSVEDGKVFVQYMDEWGNTYTARNDGAGEESFISVFFGNVDNSCADHVEATDTLEEVIPILEGYCSTHHTDEVDVHVGPPAQRPSLAITTSFGRRYEPTHVRFRFTAEQLKVDLEQMVYTMTGQHVNLSIDYDNEETDMPRFMLYEGENDEQVVAALRERGYQVDEEYQLPFQLVGELMGTEDVVISMQDLKEDGLFVNVSVPASFFSAEQ